jgi:hypothetical protein
MNGRRSFREELKAVFLKVVDDDFAVPSFVLESLLTLTFFLVFFLALDAQTREGKDFQTS